MAVFASRKLAPPVITAEGKAFFDAARQGRFLIPVCTACDRRALVSARHLPVLCQRQSGMARGLRQRDHLHFQRHAPRQGALHHRPCDARRRTDHADQYRRLRCGRCADRPGGHRCISRHGQRSASADVQAGLASFRFESSRVRVTFARRDGRSRGRARWRAEKGDAILKLDIGAALNISRAKVHPPLVQTSRPHRAQSMAGKMWPPSVTSDNVVIGGTSTRRC